MPQSSAAQKKRPAGEITGGLSSSTGDNTAGVSKKDKKINPQPQNGDFSTLVQKRLQVQANTRIGQACDRCKIRKIRCDALPEGCSSCTKLKIECYVTDRVTRRTERRGYIQELERKENGMLEYIRDMEKLLLEQGLEVKPWSKPGDENSDGGPASPPDPSEWTRQGALWIKGHSNPASKVRALRSSFRLRDELRTRSDVPLNVGYDTEPLNSMKGSILTILGAKIDTTQIEGPDFDEPPPHSDLDDSAAPLYNKSLRALHRTWLNKQPCPKVTMPSRDEAFQYTKWFFMTTGRFIMVLHEPTVLRLLAQMYDDPEFHPNVPEQCWIHVILALVYSEYGRRGQMDPAARSRFVSLSNEHYHFVVSKLYDLVAMDTIESVQALALLGTHTRGFPKPGCALIVSNLALSKALDLELHRKSLETSDRIILSNEIRKRTWWVVISLVVGLAGKRGQPMPLSVTDFDQDFPATVPDELLSEEPYEEQEEVQCPFRPGVAAVKLTAIWMETYSHLYSVRRVEHNYLNIVAALDRAADDFESELPAELKRHDAEVEPMVRFGALYTRLQLLELRLCIHHPSMAPAGVDPKLLERNSRLCESFGREILELALALVNMGGLDATWSSTIMHLGAAFSVLVVNWERRFELSLEEFNRLSAETESWTIIFKEMAILIGSGTAFLDQVKQIFAGTLGWIKRDMKLSDKNRDASANIARDVRQSSVSQQQHQSAAILSHGSPADDQVVQQSSGGHATSQPVSTMSLRTVGTNHSDNTTSHDENQPYYQGNKVYIKQDVYPTTSYQDHAQSHVRTAGYEANGPFQYGPSPHVPHAPSETSSNSVGTPQPHMASYQDASSKHQSMPSNSGVAASPINPLHAGANLAHPSMGFYHSSQENARPIDAANSPLLWPGYQNHGGTWQDWASAMNGGHEQQSKPGMMAVLGSSGVQDSSHLSNYAPMVQLGGEQAANHGTSAQLEGESVVCHIQWPLTLYDNPQG